MILATYSETLRQLRDWAGFSQEELAEKLGVNVRTFRKWERPPTDKKQRRPPARYDVLNLVTIFIEWLTPSEAQAWVMQAGYKLNRQELEAFFPAKIAGQSHQTPPLTGFYQRREMEEQALLTHLQGTALHPLVLWGTGGIGKTTLASWAANTLAEGFSDGVIWVEMSAGSAVKDIQEKIADSLGVSLNGQTDLERAGELRSFLRTKHCLLVIDDVRAAPGLSHLRVTGQTGRILITSRDAKVADILPAVRLKVGGLSRERSAALLKKWQNTLTAKQASALAERAGDLPLALNLLGARLREGDAPAALLNALRQEGSALNALELDDPQTRAESLRLCFDLSYAPLDALGRQRFAALGRFAGRFEPQMAAAVWNTGEEEALKTLRRLHRLALTDRQGRQYKLHPLLRDYARQKLREQPELKGESYSRHARYFIRHHLYHPGLLDKKAASAPSLAEAWPDIVEGVRWAAETEPWLASWAFVLAHGERMALLEAVGDSLTDALAASALAATEPAEQALLRERLDEARLWQGQSDAAIETLGQAIEGWLEAEEWIAGAVAHLKLSGYHLLNANRAAALAQVKNAQGLMSSSTTRPVNLEDLRWAFYWFDMLFNALVRWEGCREEDVIALAELGRESGHPIIEARGLHIHRLWWTAEKMGRVKTEADREKVKDLAIRAFWQWRSCGEYEKADREVSWTGYFLNGRYSRRAAARFGRRLSQTTPIVSAEALELVRDEALRWWLGASETQRVDWFSRMMPRYVGAVNIPDAPLSRESRAYRWVETILEFGTAGEMMRRPRKLLTFENKAVNRAEAVLFSSQKPLPVIGDRARCLVEQFILEMESGT